MTAYTYVKSAFTSLVADIGHRTLRETIAAAIATPALRGGRSGARFIDDLADPLYQIDFDGTLSAGQETTLDGIVAAHVGPAAGPSPGAIEFTHQHVWDQSGVTSLRYIPWYDHAETANIASKGVRQFFSGQVKLLEIVAWAVDNAPASTEFALHLNNDTSPVASVTFNMASINVPYLFDFRGESDTTAADLEAIAISFDPTGNPNGDVIAFSRWARV